MPHVISKPVGFICLLIWKQLVIHHQVWWYMLFKGCGQNNRRTGGTVPKTPTSGIYISSWKQQTSGPFSFCLRWKATFSIVILKAIFHHLNDKVETREPFRPLFCWHVVWGRFIKFFISVHIFVGLSPIPHVQCRLTVCTGTCGA